MLLKIAAVVPGALVVVMAYILFEVWLKVKPKTTDPGKRVEFVTAVVLVILLTAFFATAYVVSELP